MKNPDRNAYMSFLEVQLERVSAACLQVQGFAEDMKAVQSRLGQQEEKIVNISRLVKLLQSYSDAQEEDSQSLKNQLKSLHSRIDEVMTVGPKLSNYTSLQFASNTEAQPKRLTQIEDKLHALEDKVSSLHFKHGGDSEKRILAQLNDKTN